MRVVVYGMARGRLVELVREHGDAETTVRAISDYEAAMDLLAGTADLGIGVCQSGAGGALAVARAVLGTERCLQVSSPSRPPDDGEIVTAVRAGKVAFGIALSHVSVAVPKIITAFRSEAMHRPEPAA
jgi:hypothetical protein